MGLMNDHALEKEYERRFSGLIEKVTLKTDFPETLTLVNIFCFLTLYKF